MNTDTLALAGTLVLAIWLLCVLARDLGAWMGRRQTARMPRWEACIHWHFVNYLTTDYELHPEHDPWTRSVDA